MITFNVVLIAVMIDINRNSTVLCRQIASTPKNNCNLKRSLINAALHFSCINTLYLPTHMTKFTRTTMAGHGILSDIIFKEMF